MTFLYNLVVIYHLKIKVLQIAQLIFCVGFSHERKAEKIERKIKTQNSYPSDFSCPSAKNLSETQIIDYTDNSITYNELKVIIFMIIPYKTRNQALWAWF